jgi:hypothetical protein
VLLFINQETMPATFENPQRRKRGTASRHVARYEQPDVNEWKAADDIASEKSPGVNNNEKKESAFDRNSFQPRKRRRKQKHTTVDNDNDFSFDKVPAAKKKQTGVIKSPPRDRAKRLAEKKKIAASSAKRETKPKEAAATMKEKAASKPLVSPEDEVLQQTAPMTPSKANRSPRGKRVLEVEYSPSWDPSSNSLQDNDDDGGGGKLPGTSRGKSNTTSNPTDDNDEVDRLTSNNAADSPRPFNNSASSNRAPEENPVAVEPRTLAQVVELGGVVTKERFFSRSSQLPVLSLTIAGSMKTRPFKGRLGSGPVRWSQAAEGAGKRLLLTFPVGSSNDDRNASTEGRRQLEWEAVILDRVRACCGDSDPQLKKSFPKPSWLGTPENGNHVLCLCLTSETDAPVEFDVLGTLEDFMYMFVTFNNGPISEMLCARLVAEVVKCVRLLHFSGVTHNNLGLDSFFLVRRKQTSTCDANDWFLVCTGLGSDATVCGRQGDETTRDNGNRPAWRFKHDLLSVANIAHLLLSGGVPLSFTRNTRSGLNELRSSPRHFDSSIYLRGKMTWGAVFETLLNPPNESCSLHPSNDLKWKNEVMHMLNMLSMMSSPNEEMNVSLLDQLLQHVRHDEADCFHIREGDRIVVKLIEATDGSPPDSHGDGRPSAREMELSRALDKERATVSRLTDEFRQASEQKETFRQLNSKSTEAAERALSENEELVQEKNKLVKLVTLAGRQKSGFEATIQDRDHALANLRSQVRKLEQDLESKKQQHRAAQEKIQSLEERCRQSDAKLQSAMGLIGILQQEERVAEDVEAEKRDKAPDALRADHGEVVQLLREENEAELTSQNERLAQLEAQLSEEVGLRKEAQATVARVQDELTRRMQSAEAEKLLAIERETGHLRNMTLSLERQKLNADSDLQSQRRSFDAKLSAKEAEPRQVEQELEGRELAHRQQNGGAHRASPERKTKVAPLRLEGKVVRRHEEDGAQRAPPVRLEGKKVARRRQNDGAQRASPPVRPVMAPPINQDSASRQKPVSRRASRDSSKSAKPFAPFRDSSKSVNPSTLSRAPSKSTKPAVLSRESSKSSNTSALYRHQDQAAVHTASIIPGLGMTLDRFRPQHQGFQSSSSSISSITSRTGSHSKSRIVIGDPHQPDSDSDSD